MSKSWERAPSPATLATCGALVALAGAATWSMQLGLGTIDDAYITLRIARNWANGFGPVFNPGERVEAATSPAWLALAALGLRLGVSGTVVLAVLQLAAAALSGSAAALLARRIGGPPAALLAPLLLALLASFSAWAGCGMETPLAGAALAWATLAAVSAASTWGAAAAGGAAALAALVRPEMTAVGPALCAAAAFRSNSLRGRPLAAATTCWLLPLGATALARHAYFGAWLPNTYVAKVAGGGLDLRLRGLHYAAGFVALHAVLVASAAWAMRRWPHARAPGLVAGFFLAAVAWSGGDHFGLYRLAVPVLPLLCALGSSLSALGGWTRTAALASLVVIQPLLVGLWPHQLARVRNEVAYTQDLEEIGDSLQRAPPGMVAVIAIGAIGWESARPILDLVGLADAHLARSPRIPRAASGHDHGDVDYVLARAPELVLPEPLLTRAPFDDAKELASLAAYRRYFAAGEQLVRDARFRARYRPFDLPTWSGRHLRVWRRIH